MTALRNRSSYAFPRRRRWHPTPVLLPGKSHGRRTLVGCSPWGLEESDMTERLHFHFSLSCIGEENGTPPQCSCLENPRDGGAWWAAVYGIAQSRTRLKRLSSSSSSSSISSRTYWLFACLLWRNVYSNPLPIFQWGLLFFLGRFLQFCFGCFLFLLLSCRSKSDLFLPLTLHLGVMTSCLVMKTSNWSPGFHFCPLQFILFTLSSPRWPC